MDGDHGIVPIDWVKAVFQSLIELAGNKKILVLSVLGIQSSGKSTLLNAMFGLEFAVSAGRCTRGIYAQLLPVRDQPNQRFDYMLVIDSEGLRSQQREQKYQYDNELATLVIGLSDVALINRNGRCTTNCRSCVSKNETCRHSAKTTVYHFIKMLQLSMLKRNWLTTDKSFKSS